LSRAKRIPNKIEDVRARLIRIEGYTFTEARKEGIYSLVQRRRVRGGPGNKWLFHNL